MGEFFPTPAWCVSRFLEECRLPGGRWLEPSAGEGDIISAVRGLRNDVTWSAVEFDDQREPALRSNLAPDDECIIDDFLSMKPSRLAEPPDVVLGNPPFSLSALFVRRALDLGARYVALLLRLGFIASTSRNDLIQKHPPDLYILPQRPSFTPNGQTDRYDYAWFVWPWCKSRDYGYVKSLALTPRDERTGGANNVTKARSRLGA